MLKRLHLIIHGRVQGVGFRWYTREKALELGLVGWVRNNPNGTVEIVAEGEETELKKLRDWCVEGPRFAMVERMEEKWEDICENDLIDFNIVL